MASVRMQNIVKHYGNVPAVNDVTIAIEDKEFLVLVGPSGCGKSTLLRMIAGLEPITGGEMYIGDRLINDVAPKDRDIAMVFQNYALYPHMSVYDNLAYSLKVRKTPKDQIKARVTKAAELLAITELLQRKPKQLSGGQRQRVAVGRAIVREPQVFLMDEPLSNLDAQLRVQTRAELVKLHQRLQTTVVYVTHDQVEAMTMGTRIAIMSGGVLQQLDTPQQVYDYPANMFVAGFIGSPPMNLMPGQVEEVDGRMYVHVGSWKMELRPYLAERVRSHGNIRDVIFGVRPEDVFLAEEGANPGGGGNAVVDVVEHLGAELLVYVNVAGAPVALRMDAATGTKPGQTLALSMAPQKVHLFDPATEKSLAAA